MQNRDVLISGAGIAGPALAYWLSEHGFTTTVVERAPAPRAGGQTVDLRGAGRTVIERMGLMDRVRGVSVDQRGIAFVGADGQIAARMPAELFGGEGIVSEAQRGTGTPPPGRRRRRLRRRTTRTRALGGGRYRRFVGDGPRLDVVAMAGRCQRPRRTSSAISPMNEPPDHQDEPETMSRYSSTAYAVLVSAPPNATSATVMEPSTTPRPPGVIGNVAASWPAP